MKITSISLGLLATLSALACSDRRPEPFGKLGDKLGAWAKDCEAPLSVEGIIRGPDPFAGERGYDTPFQAAALQYVCPHPGWSLYVGTNDRIVGLCVDERGPQIWPVEKDGEDYLVRARRLLSRHVSEQFAADVTQGDRCTFFPQQIAHDLRRWNQTLRSVVGPDGNRMYHPPVGTLRACCWEVIDP